MKDLLIHLGIMLCLIAILVLGFFFLYLPNTTNHGETVTVPELTGMDVKQVEEFLSSRDLRYEINDSTYLANKPGSIVLTQYPKAGEKVKENRKIYITITTNNPPNIEMPKLVDISLRSAQMLLQSYELQQGELKYVPNLAQNLVLKQQFNGKDIEPGTKIPKGSKIDLTVGDGIGNTEMEIPNLIGQTLAEARMAIEGSDLVLGSIIPETAKDKPQSVVTRQNPAPSETNKIRMGEVVDLWVEERGSAPESSDSAEPSN
jgi:beta-lactam-binding protein with PASTA domain